MLSSYLSSGKPFLHLVLFILVLMLAALCRFAWKCVTHDPSRDPIKNCLESNHGDLADRKVARIERGEIPYS